MHVASNPLLTISLGKAVEFEGLRVRLATESLQEAAFQRIPAGESIEITFDVAEVHDLSAGGKFDIATIGALSFAEDAGTQLIGSVSYESNTLEVNVDGEEASNRRVDFHGKRTTVQSDCTGSKLTITQRALSNCASLASSAQRAASSGPAAKVTEYFKSSSSSTRTTVANVFARVASECGSTRGGASKYYCSDVYGGCSNGVLAYTLPSGSFMAYCDLYFQQVGTPINCACLCPLRC